MTGPVDPGLVLAGVLFLLWGIPLGCIGVREVSELVLAFLLVPVGLAMVYAGWTGVGL